MIEKWNMIHASESLGALLLLMINHPSIDNTTVNISKLKTEFFDLIDSIPRFCKSAIETG